MQTATKKKKKDDKASSDEDEDDGYEDDDDDDDDEALASPDASRVFTITVPELVFMAFASSTISGRTEGVTAEDIRDWIIEDVDEWNGVTDEELLKKLVKNIGCVLSKDDNYQVLPKTRPGRFLQISNPAPRNFRSPTISQGIRIKIKGEGDEEDIIFTATGATDARRKLEKEHGPVGGGDCGARAGRCFE